MNPKILVLALHRVGHPPGAARIRGLFTTPTVLKAQIWLLRLLGFEFTTLAKALSSSGRSAVVTFDDGYEDNFTEAMPLLERRGIPATIFVVTSDIGRTDVVWDEAAEDLPAKIVDWSMLEQLRLRGWEVASHGEQHVHFDRRSKHEQTSLIARSMAEIEKHLGIVPVSFAYPYGAYNDLTTESLESCGIRFAVTMNQPSHRCALKGPLEIDRLAIGGRRIDHILKNTIKTLRALGTADVLRTLVRVPGRALTPVSSQLTSLNLGRQNNT